MAKIEYNVVSLFPEQVTGIDLYDENDIRLVGDFTLANTFKTGMHNMEVHAYDLTGILLKSSYNYKGYSFLATAAGAGKSGESRLEIDPVQDAIELGYNSGDVRLVYNFVNNLYSKRTNQPRFYIETISKDRMELRLLTPELTDGFISRVTNNIEAAINSESYFSDFRLNFLENKLAIGVNISSQQYKGQTAVLVRLYEPLPKSIKRKDLLTIVDIVSDEKMEVQEVTENSAMALRKE